MKKSNVIETLNMALEASGCDQANVVHKRRLLSDNGTSYISHELADYVKETTRATSEVHRITLRGKVKLNGGTKR